MLACLSRTRKKQKNFLDFFFSQEFDNKAAKDFGSVFGVGKTVTAAGITCSNYAHTQNTTQIEPSLIEHESYAPNVDLVLTEEPEATEELIP